jgi:hypothetical protein
MSTEKNANHFREMYAELQINIDKLGCIMLNIDGSAIPKLPDESILYFTAHPDRFWIKGFVAGEVPHVTLLYGLMESGQKNKAYVDKVLNGWSIGSVTIDHVDFFNTPYQDEPYYCIIAHLAITPELLEGHQRLEFLPHINTFPDYKAHITIAYIKSKNNVALHNTLEFYNEALRGKTLPVTGLNYGK